MSGRLCVVEDDPTIRQMVSVRLEKEGYEVQTSESAESILTRLEQEALADLYILDIRLRGEMDGLALCEKLRKKSPKVPILILSALSDPNDRVEGLRLGADDYLSKPFEMDELLLRVGGMLKRRSWYTELNLVPTVFRWAKNEVNFETFSGKHGFHEFVMTQKECMLMKLLVEREEQVIHRDDILDHVWGYNVFPSTRTVDNFISRLRRYFEDDPKSPKYIHSVRGLGYRFSSKGNA